MAALAGGLPRYGAAVTASQDPMANGTCGRNALADGDPSQRAKDRKHGASGEFSRANTPGGGESQGKAQGEGCASRAGLPSQQPRRAALICRPLMVKQFRTAQQLGQKPTSADRTNLNIPIRRTSLSDQPVIGRAIVALAHKPGVGPPDKCIVFRRRRPHGQTIKRRIRHKDFPSFFTDQRRAVSKFRHRNGPQVGPAYIKDGLVSQDQPILQRHTDTKLPVISAEQPQGRKQQAKTCNPNRAFGCSLPRLASLPTQSHRLSPA